MGAGQGKQGMTRDERLEYAAPLKLLCIKHDTQLRAAT